MRGVAAIAEVMSFPDFLRRRVNRLYPTYVIGLCLGLLVALAALRFPGSGLSVRWTAASIFFELLVNFAFFFCAACCGSP